MRKTIVYTLAYNTPGEIEKMFQRIYGQNDPETFIHYACDLGFPLLTGEIFPEDIAYQKKFNTSFLKTVCDHYGSQYVKLDNIGVSQNHTQFYKYFHDNFEVGDEDVFVSADPDEVTHDANWIGAMAAILRADKAAMCSLYQTQWEKGIDSQYYDEVNIGGIRAWRMKGVTNFPLIGFSGRFINLINRVIGVPDEANIYGYIEGTIMRDIGIHGMDWYIIPDYRVTHSDDVKLYRAWKDAQIFGRKSGQQQISFDLWLEGERG